MAITIWDNLGQRPLLGDIGDETYIRDNNTFYTYFNAGVGVSYANNFTASSYFSADNVFSTESTFSIDYYSNKSSLSSGGAQFTFLNPLNTSLNDISVNNYTITNSGALSAQITPFESFASDSSSAYFTTNKWAKVNLTDNFDSVGSPFTVEFWAYPWTSPTTTNPPISFSDSNGENSFTLTGSRLTIKNTNFTLGSGILPAKAWSHVALTYDGFNYKLYNNGTEVSINGNTFAVNSQLNKADFDRTTDARFECYAVFPSNNSDGVLWFQGGNSVLYLDNGGTTLRLRTGAYIDETSSNEDTIFLSTTDIPKDDQVHKIAWDFRVNPGRARLWIDGVLKDSDSTVGGGPLYENYWADEEVGGYGLAYSSIVKVLFSSTIYNSEIGGQGGVLASWPYQQFADNGTKLFTFCPSDFYPLSPVDGNIIRRLDLTTPYDLNTATQQNWATTGTSYYYRRPYRDFKGNLRYRDVYTPISGLVLPCYGFFIHPDGGKFWSCYGGTSTIRQFNINSGGFDLSTGVSLDYTASTRVPGEFNISGAPNVVQFHPDLLGVEGKGLTIVGPYQNIMTGYLRNAWDLSNGFSQVVTSWGSAIDDIIPLRNLGISYIRDIKFINNGFTVLILSNATPDSRGRPYRYTGPSVGGRVTIVDLEVAYDLRTKIVSSINYVSINYTDAGQIKFFGPWWRDVLSNDNILLDENSNYFYLPNGRSNYTPPVPGERNGSIYKFNINVLKTIPDTVWPGNIVSDLKYYKSDNYDNVLKNSYMGMGARLSGASGTSPTDIYWGYLKDVKISSFERYTSDFNVDSIGLQADSNTEFLLSAVTTGGDILSVYDNGIIKINNIQDSISYVDQDGVWEHTTILYDGTDLNFYKNSELIATKPATFNSDLNLTNVLIGVGSQFDQGYATLLRSDYYTGYIKDFSILNGNITPEERTTDRVSNEDTLILSGGDVNPLLDKSFRNLTISNVGTAVTSTKFSPFSLERWWVTGLGNLLIDSSYKTSGPGVLLDTIMDSTYDTVLDRMSVVLKLAKYDEEDNEIFWQTDITNTHNQIIKLGYDSDNNLYKIQPYNSGDSAQDDISVNINFVAKLINDSNPVFDFGQGLQNEYVNINVAYNGITTNLGHISNQALLPYILDFKHGDDYDSNQFAFEDHLPPETTTVIIDSADLLLTLGDSFDTAITTSDYRLYSRIDLDWHVSGLINKASLSSTEVIEGSLFTDYDSDFVLTRDRPAPIITLEDTDDSGNSIIWSVTITQPPVPTGSVGPSISLIYTAGSPTYSINPNPLYISPQKTRINFTGTVAGKNPYFAEVDPEEMPESLEIIINYSDYGVFVSDYNVKVAGKLINIGSPKVRYIGSYTFNNFPL